MQTNRKSFETLKRDLIHSKTDWLKQPRNWSNLTNVVGRYVSNQTFG